MKPDSDSADPAAPTLDQGDRRWASFKEIVFVIGALVPTAFVALTFPSNWARLLAVLGCVAVTGLIRQALRDGISRGMVAWLTASGLAIGSLVFVLVDQQAPSSSHPPPADAARDGGASNPGGGSTGVESDRRGEQHDGHVPSPASGNPDSLPLDELPVAAGGSNWRRGAEIIDRTTYQLSLVAPSGPGLCGWASVDYNLYREWSRFTVTVGVPDDRPTGTSAQFAIIADGQELYSSSPLPPGTGEPLDINITDVFRLTLRTASCDDHIGVWGDPTLLR